MNDKKSRCVQTYTMSERSAKNEGDKSPVEASLERLREALEKISHQVEELQSCLHHVLGDLVEGEEPTKLEDSTASCPLDREILDLCQLARSTFIHLEILRDRIKI